MMRISWRALAHSTARPIGGSAMGPIVAPARDSLRKAAEHADANVRQLTYILLDRAHDDPTDCAAESHGGGLGGTRCDALVLRSRSSRGLPAPGAGQDCFQRLWGIGDSWLARLSVRQGWR